MFFTTALNAQDDRMIRVIGDSLVGKYLNGENIREVHGNVVMTQGAVRITCNKAIQYLARNEAELLGKVVVTQDSITISTDVGYYYGNSKVAYSKSGIDFYDGHVRLNSKHGYYYFDEKRAHFFENVKLKDSISTLFTDQLTYFDDEDKAVAVGNVAAKDSISMVFADSLVHLRKEKISFANGNVIVYDSKNRLAIFGGKLEDFKNKNYSKISDNPFLIKIDTTDAGKLDTLVISAKLMEAYGDSTKRLVATDSVKIVRDEFSSINNFTIFYQQEERLYTYRRLDDPASPVLWNGDTQLIGDTVNIFLKDNRLDKMSIVSNASIITPNKNNEFRFDQISGKELLLLFGDNRLQRTDVAGNVLSIYYMYEDGEPNGLLKSSSESAKIFFDENNVGTVKLYGNPISEFHPENVIEGKEKDFTLPTFVIIKNKPQKEKLLPGIYRELISLSEKIEKYGK